MKILFALLCTTAALAQPTTPLTDPRDNKTYKTVKIGKQIWMVENLNYEAEGSRCYNNEPANCEKYGRLYNWNMAKSACPKGWHLPSKDEWQILVKFVGGESIAGKKLKATSGWNYYKGKSGNGTNTFDFSALPCGRSDGLWWSANESDSYFAYCWHLYYNGEGEGGGV